MRDMPGLPLLALNAGGLERWFLGSVQRDGSFRLLFHGRRRPRRPRARRARGSPPSLRTRPAVDAVPGSSHRFPLASVEKNPSATAISPLLKRLPISLGRHAALFPLARGDRRVHTPWLIFPLRESRRRRGSILTLAVGLFRPSPFLTEPTGSPGKAPRASVPSGRPA